MKVSLGEKQAQSVLLVRAFEESDRKGRLLTENLRSGATRRALMVTGFSRADHVPEAAFSVRNGETITRRARIIYEALRRRVPILVSILHLVRLGSGTTPSLLGLSFLFGLVAMRYGTRNGLDLLAWPIYLLLFWNLMAYGLILVLEVVRRRVTRTHGGSEQFRHRLLRRGVATYLAAMLLRWALWRRLQRWKLRHDGDPTRREIVARAVIRFGALWHRLAGDLLSARVRELLHWSVVSIAIGICIDLQIRSGDPGTRISWHGSWLEAEQAQAFLRTVLSPTSWVTGIKIPELSASASSNQSETWIALLTITLILCVIVPRTLFAIGERLRSNRLASNLAIDTDDGYYRRVFAPWRGASSQAIIHPFRYRPPPPTIPSVNAALYDLLGARAMIHCADPGLSATSDDHAFAAPATDGDRCRRTHIVLFNLSHDPHPELHARFLTDLMQRLEKTGECLLALVDPAEALHARMPSAERKRRIEIWRTVISGAGLETAVLNVGRPTGDDWLSRVAKITWKPAQVNFQQDSDSHDSPSYGPQPGQ